MPTTPLNLLLVFNAQPGATLLLSPEWVILGASDDYLAATLTERHVIVGQFIFAAFPDNPDTPEANAVANVRASLEQVLATKQPHEMAPQHYDVPDRTQPGRFIERHWQPRHTPVLDAAGQVQFIIQSVQDITARRQAEQQLRESQAAEQAARAEVELQRTELRRIFAEAPVAMGLLRGPAFVVEWANPRMGQIWGRPVAQVLGRSHFEALPDLAGQGFEQVFADVLTTGRSRTFHELPVHIAQDQQPYLGYFDLTFQPVYDGPERITGILSFAVEVTEQVRVRQQVQDLNEELAALNEELRASNEEYQQANLALSETQQQLQQLNQELEERVQARTRETLTLQADLLAAAERQVQARETLYQIFAQTPAAICIQRGPTHRYEYANQAYQNFFPGRSLLGRSVAEALPETVDSGVVALLDRVYQTGETYYGYELPLLIAQPAGPPQQMYFTFTYQALRENGEIVGISTFAYNVAEQVLARQQVEGLNQELAAINEELTATNEELHESNAQLTRTNVDLDTFVYTASHDLKAPITNIESIALALRTALPPAVQQDEVVAHLLTLLNKTTARFQTTITQLTDISRLQLAHVGPAEPIVLAHVVEEVRQDLAPMLDAAGSQLTVDISPDLVVSFSPANLRSVVYNLLSNAVKYRASDHPCRVQVRAASTPRGVVLAVQDNGLGMSEGQQRQLFGLFQRLHTHVEGTGVGLYISKRLIENAGGTIAVQSQPGRGSTFTVTFPT